jgi:pimeloyl-ACP methyl ester carboxylesterase
MIKTIAHEGDSTQRAEAVLPAFGSLPLAPAIEYGVDAAQRTTLLWDVLRRRGNQFLQDIADPAPQVLSYEAEVVVDGRILERPVNYRLLRIVPPEGVQVDPTRRPFVIVDPRAGHGPGIGGFKSDSEIGVALKAGHPCYLIAFLRDPVPGQTIEDIARAEALFIEKVIVLHPKAEGKPCVIGNCQAGWAVTILAARRPELFGPIILAGSPLSYWAGVHGKNPMRYSGGLLGGSWLTALSSDLGKGKFDGAWLVQNFENQNPANTLWRKPYNLYANIDTEAPRYLGFERWWGGHVNLNRDEIQAIVDELFIGNKLSAGMIRASDGTTIDLRNIRSPILVFCSEGDNITPPQQALGWILDLYEDVDDIRSHGQTIVYTVHESVGHLGVFVSTDVARKQYGEFTHNIDLIDVLPPGLYEAVFEQKTGDTGNPDLVTGEWVMRCEERTLDDIRALGANDAADERRFATAARISEINLGLYRTFAQPVVRAFISKPAAEWLRKLHPLRLQYELLSDQNPWMAPVGAMADAVRKNRRPASSDNPLLELQKTLSDGIASGLDAWRRLNETVAEQVFLTVFGSPALQAAAGIDPAGTRPLRKAGRTPLHDELVKIRITELKTRMTSGSAIEGAIRALIYAGRPRGAIDARAFESIRRMRELHCGAQHVTLPEFKAILRDQGFLLLLDPVTAVAALPVLIPDAESRRWTVSVVRELLSANGGVSGEVAVRLQHVENLLQTDAENAPASVTAAA